MAAREAPAWFVARMQQYPDFVCVRFNELVGLWEFVMKSAAGLDCSQFYGWDRNPLTGAPIDSETGVMPFRDLDPTACQEILDSCDRTYLGNRDDGAGTWKRQSDRAIKTNAGIRKDRAKARGQTFADLLKEVDLRRPWQKYHTPGQYIKVS